MLTLAYYLLLFLSEKSLLPFSPVFVFAFFFLRVDGMDMWSCALGMVAITAYFLYMSVLFFFPVGWIYAPAHLGGFCHSL